MHAFDSFLVIIFILSVIYGSFQGISKAVSSGLSALVSSVYLAFLCLTPFKNFLLEFNAHEWVVKLALPILSIIVLIMLKAFGAIFSQMAERTHTKLIDDMLGAIWGIVRGAAIIKLVFWIVYYAGMVKLLETSSIFPFLSSVVKVF